MRVAIIVTAAFAFAVATAARAEQDDIHGKWDIFDDGCRSGYLEFRADGGFGQVYRRDDANWITDPVWGRGTYRLDGDILYTVESKLDGSVRIETKERLSFADPDRLDTAFLELVWVDNASNAVESIEGFEESWPRCPAGAVDRVVPVVATTLVDADLLVGRWGWSRGCESGYVEYTRDGRIWLVDTDEAGEGTLDPEFLYGLYEVRDKTLLEVYSYESGTWKSETNIAFDDLGGLFFSDGMKATWTETGGSTEDDDPFFSVLFRCAAADAEASDPETEEALERAREAKRTEAVEVFLFDSDVALIARAVENARERCRTVYQETESGGIGAGGAAHEAIAGCVDVLWSFLDVSGDDLLSLSEIARGMRLFAKWSAEEQARKKDESLDTETKLGIHVIGVMLSLIGAKPVLDSYDYDDDGLLSRSELFADTDLADAVALSQRPVGDIIDIEGILEKLQAIIQMTTR